MGITQRHLARKKRDGVPFGSRLGFFNEQFGFAALDDPAVIGAIRFRLIAPPHLEIILPDDVPGIGESRVAREYRVTAQVNEVCVLPEHPHGNGVDNSLEDLLRRPQRLLGLLLHGDVAHEIQGRRPALPADENGVDIHPMR